MRHAASRFYIRCIEKYSCAPRGCKTNINGRREPWCRGLPAKIPDFENNKQPIARNNGTRKNKYILLHIRHDVSVVCLQNSSFVEGNER